MTNDELGRLDELLEATNPDDAMVVEEVDGFFAALACAHRPVSADEYLPVVVGRAINGTAVAAGGASIAAGAAASGDHAAAVADELAGLLERHRRSVQAQLEEGSGFAPVFSHDEQGKARGNAWAIGFVRGMAMRADAWDSLQDDEEFVDALDPVMRLVAEVEPLEDEPPEEIADDERDAVIGEMIQGVMDIYDIARTSGDRHASG
ncbi:MAG TPA: YecA family protein [Burkholderiaceae bacterium]|nr:YecA family protein [Burkholderiaceae bacterium]